MSNREASNEILDYFDENYKAHGGNCVGNFIQKKLDAAEQRGLEKGKEEIRSYAKRELLRTMEDISEHHYCAGWMHDIEYELWEIVNAGGGRYGQDDISNEEAEKILHLARDANGWWIWSDALHVEIFIELEEWKRLYRLRMEKKQ